MIEIVCSSVSENHKSDEAHASVYTYEWFLTTFSRPLAIPSKTCLRASVAFLATLNTKSWSNWVRFSMVCLCEEWGWELTPVDVWLDDDACTNAFRPSAVPTSWPIFASTAEISVRIGNTFARISLKLCASYCNNLSLRRYPEKT